MSSRRKLQFHSLDEVLVELSALDGRPVRTSGRWSFYQILTHLAEALEYSISEYPRAMPFLIRRTIGPMALRHLLKTKEMKAGAPNPNAPRKREEGDEQAAMLRLRTAIASFRAHEGPMAEHPFFGPINKEDYEAVHAHHAALHLSFVHPDSLQAESQKQPESTETAAETEKLPEQAELAATAEQPTVKQEAAAPEAKKASKKAARKKTSARSSSRKSSEKSSATATKKASKKSAKKAAKKASRKKSSKTKPAQPAE